ncbi:MAG: hypothetical protein KC461_06545 [Dehalococcoidia bacterium]|nr:hypothetical protein [Dehalococcoidia bacterium]MCB9610554.1 hypothetical protein [Polyangiaceae bacterium]
MKSLTVQHDRVRQQRDLLAGIDGARPQPLRGGTLQDDLIKDLANLHAGMTSEVQESLLAGIRQLDWLLQGHFGDEEDDLFAPGVEVFSTQQLDSLAIELEEIRARFT